MDTDNNADPDSHVKSFSISSHISLIVMLHQITSTNITHMRYLK